jgi:hypothetical protein
MIRLSRYPPGYPLALAPFVEFGDNSPSSAQNGARWLVSAALRGGDERGFLLAHYNQGARLVAPAAYVLLAFSAAGAARMLALVPKMLTRRGIASFGATRFATGNHVPEGKDAKV